ncbi:MAG TPA: FeS-binding protein [Desulfobacteraceae bacterium]|nr:FeS-binding protein [Desulfobacteraceae bacterium]
MKTLGITPRKIVQHVFLGIVVVIGIRFYQFVCLIESGVAPGFDRPPGVEAFLPISALVSLKHLLVTGSINPVHPSGLVLFLIICGTALMARRGFCSWICPVGLISEYLGRIRLFRLRSPFVLPRFMDFPLRSLKYMAAGFFVYQIFFKMPGPAVEAFIYSTYNRFADIQMLKFFTDMSSTAWVVLVVLAVLSVLFRHFWCRYLCPYGALLGVIGFFSPGRVRRDVLRCSGCGKCSRNCPGQIQVASKTRVDSAECSACLTCVENCPEEKALKFSFSTASKGLNGATMAVMFILVFGLGITCARWSGNWQNDILVREYLRFAGPAVPSPLPQGINPGNMNPASIDPKKMKRMIQMMQRLKEQQALTVPPGQ